MPHQFKAGKVAGDPETIEVTRLEDSGSGLAQSKDELTMAIAHDGKFTAPMATGTIREQESAVIQLVK